MSVNWFDIILYTIKPFCGSFTGEDANALMTEVEELSDKISDLGAPDFTFDEEKEEWVRNKDQRTVAFVEFLKKHGWLNRTIGGRMCEYMELDVRKVVDDQVSSIYEHIKNIQLKDENKELYLKSLSELIATKGRSANSKNRKKDITFDLLPEDKLTEFGEMISRLSSADDNAKTLNNLCKFSLLTGLNTLSYYEMTGKRNVTYNIIDVIVPALDAVSNIEKMEADEKSDIYEALIGDYESDNELIEAFSKTNVAEIYKDFKLDSLKKALEKIQSVYVKKNILTNQLDDILGDESICESYKDVLKDATGNDDITPVFALECAVSPEDAGITDKAKMKSVYDAVSDICSVVLKRLTEYAFSIEQNIVNTDAIMKDDFYLNDKLVISLPVCVDKWKSFIESDMYRSELFGKPMDDAVKEIAQKILRGKKFGLLNKKNCSDIIKVLKNIDLTKPMSEDIRFAFNFSSVEPDVFVTSSAWLQLLQFIKKFFQEPFNVKQDAQMSNVTGKNYYSAACVLIYLKDGSISESYGEIVSAMVFEGIAIFEEKSYVKYFNSLAKAIMDYIKDGKEGTRNVFTYIKDNIKQFGLPNKGENEEEKPTVEVSNEEAKKVETAAEEVKTAAANFAK